MSKCPYCHFENEAGLLFCEQCKSDLGQIEPVAIRPAPDSHNGEGMPAIAESVAVAEPVHVAALVEEPIMAGAIPIAEASPVYTFAKSAVQETLNGEPADLVPEPAAPPAAVPSETASSSSSQSTLDQVIPPAVADKLPTGSKPKLIVLRGQRQNVEYQIYDGDNYIGRADDKAVDLDLEDQEPPDRIWSSRQHAVISYEGSSLTIEDLHSTNGTYLNRTRIEAGKKIPLALNDVIQIGTVQLKIVL
jgi:hypothetical protein